MSTLKRKIALSLFAATTALLSVSVALPTAHAAVLPEKRIPAPTITITPPPVGARTQESPFSTVTAVGLNNKTQVIVTYSSGGQKLDTQNIYGDCSVKAALKNPAKCTDSVSFLTSDVGDNLITVTVNGKPAASATFTILPTREPWSPPEGFTQPTGWSMMSSTATYVPCSTVYWYYDRSSEPAANNTMHDEVAADLAVLAKETGLVFVETTDPKQATLSYEWQDLTSWGSGIAGIGGPSGNGTGSVAFATGSKYLSNAYAGLNLVITEWNEGNTHYTMSTPGRGWIVIHETMHAMGFGHVDDPTSIMSPVGRTDNGSLNAGDLDGLHTMYLNNPCPV